VIVEEDIPGRFYDGRLMRRLLTYLRPYGRRVGAAAALLSAMSLLQVAGPLLTKLAVDRYMTAATDDRLTAIERWFPSDRGRGLVAVSLAYLAVLLLIAMFDFAQSWLMQSAGQHAMSDLRRDLMRRLQTLDLAYFDRNPVGRLVTRVTTDVDALNDLFTSGVVSILGDFFMLALMTVAMLRLNARLTLLLLAVMPFVVLATLRFRRAAADTYRRARVAVARINAYLAEHINGMTVVQLFNHEETSAAQFDRINAEKRDAEKDAAFANSWFNPIVEFQGMLALAGVLAYGGFQTRRGGVTLGVLVAFFQYALRFFRPIQELSDKYTVLQSAVAASEKIFALLDCRPSILAPPRAGILPRGPLPIEFDHVWFAYQGDDWVLRDVQFTVRPGETVAVVGHTGAGKTTIASLLLRFYDVQRGAIRVGGIDVRELDPIELRQRFGIALQDPHLFTGTIADNIRLDAGRVSDTQLIASARGVNLHDFVESQPHGFAQPIRERGHGLSFGQKQLIAFARALAHDPPYLILDEATSSVDTETEVRVRQALASMLRGRSAIVIAHRLSTVRRADRILVMHKGRLRESGTHAQLLAQRGLYWNLYRLQYRDQDTDAEDATSDRIAG
jgi:ATP-binding cassette subfamily B protein